MVEWKQHQTRLAPIYSWNILKDFHPKWGFWIKIWLGSSMTFPFWKRARGATSGNKGLNWILKIKMLNACVRWQWESQNGECNVLDIVLLSSLQTFKYENIIFYLSPNYTWWCIMKLCNNTTIIITKYLRTSSIMWHMILKNSLLLWSLNNNFLKTKLPCWKNIIPDQNIITW